MAHEVVRLETTPPPDLAHLAEEVARTRPSRVIRRGDTDVAVLFPVGEKPAKRRRGKIPTPAQIETALSAFGAWKGHFDAGAFKRQVKESREDNRPPVKL